MAVQCQHTPGQPADWDVLGWYAYAEHMSKTHRQVRCQGCGLFKIWVPKVPRATKSAINKVLRQLAGAEPTCQEQPE